MLPDATDLIGPMPPTSINRPLVQKLIKKLDAGEPRFVDVNPLPDCPKRDCFNNVAKIIASLGGEMVLGWCIWEHPKLFARAEHHAVWKKPGGSLVDPTPKDGGLAKILFVPDEKATWCGPGHNGRKSVWQENREKRDAIELVRLEKLREDLLEKVGLAMDEDELSKIDSQLCEVVKQLQALDQILYQKGLLKRK